MSEIIITQTISPKNYCKYEHTMCEFANDRGYCVKTGCSKRIIINEKPYVNKNLVEVVRCKDCRHAIFSHTVAERSADGSQKRRFLCDKTMLPQQYNDDNWFCADGERKEDAEADR